MPVSECMAYEGEAKLRQKSVEKDNKGYSGPKKWLFATENFKFDPRKIGATTVHSQTQQKHRHLSLIFHFRRIQYITSMKNQE